MKCYSGLKLVSDKGDEGSNSVVVRKEVNNVIGGVVEERWKWERRKCRIRGVESVSLRQFYIRSSTVSFRLWTRGDVNLICVFGVFRNVPDGGKGEGETEVANDEKEGVPEVRSVWIQER